MKNFFALFLSTYLFILTPAPAQQTERAKTSPREGNGLLAEYFNGSNFQEKVVTRIDEEINFYYLNESPAPGVNTENYSIRWQGKLYAPVTGTYKVLVRVDDGVRLWLNGKMLLDKWQLQEATTYGGKLNLKGGEFYTLKIEYFNQPLDAVMRLMWESPEDKTTSFFGLFEDTPRKVIPKKYLFGKLPEPEPNPKPTEVKKEAVVKRTTLARKLTQSTKGNHPVAGVENRKPTIIPRKNRAEPAEINPFKELKTGKVVQFKNVWFEQGKYLLLPGSHRELDKLARALEKNPAIKIRVEGHTDNVGDPNLNQALSLFRAKVVATYLIDKGVDPGRIETKGYGHTQPLADNSTEEGRAINRRVQFVVE